MSILPHIFDELHPRFRDTWYRPAISDCLSKLNEIQDAKVGEDGFQVCIDVQHFQPNEITVTTENKFIIVQAKHEERKDAHGLISREFTRRYQIPEDLKIENVVSSLSSDGILSIKVPRKTQEVKSNVHYIQIQQEDPERLNTAKNAEKIEIDVEKDIDQKK